MLGGSGAAAQEYISGHGALEIWDAEARADVPQWIRIWLRIMQLTFIAGIIFVWNRIEARWAVGGFVAVFATAVLSQTLTNLVPLSGFIALTHLVFWSPVLYLLLTRRPFLRERSVYAIWTAVLTVVLLVTFMFDVPSAVIYLDHVFGWNELS